MAIQTLRKIFFGNFILKGHSELQSLLNQIDQEKRTKTDYGWMWIDRDLSETSTYQQIKAKNPAEKRELVLELVAMLPKLKSRLARRSSYRSSDPDISLERMGSLLLERLIRQKLDLREDDFIFLLNTYANVPDRAYYHLNCWPVGYTVKQLERFASNNLLSPDFQAFLTQYIQQADFDQKRYYWGSNLPQVKLKIETLLHRARSGNATVPPLVLSEQDSFGRLVNQSVNSLSGKMRPHYYELLHLAATASGAKPTKKYSKAIEKIVEATGAIHLRETVRTWLAFLISMDNIEEEYHQTWQNRTYTYTTHIFLQHQNATIAKGLVWSLVQVSNPITLVTIGQLAERAFRKIPGVGATAMALGNACLYLLAHSEGTEGVAYLSGLKTKMSQNNIRQRIQQCIEQKSVQLGISPHEVEEMVVPHYDLTAGRKEIIFDDYTLEVSIQGIGKINQVWRKSDGSTQKSVPSFVKQSTVHQSRLTAVRAEIKEIKKNLTTQRDRIDRSYVQNRSWAYEKFCQYYLHHGLVGWLAQRLIWSFELGEQTIPAIWRNNHWEDVDGNPLNGINDITRVTLWHPIQSKTEEVLAWRERLEHLEIQQPLKQAYREIYLLTDAEVNTRFYSNRMAAHILKQHQLNALAGVRGWKYSLMGAFDDGRDRAEVAINLPDHNLQASFWINEMLSEEAMNDTGIWLYVATDQVRFTQDDKVLNLIDVPPLIFSEIMRDVDLFVGVTSVGNDPQWQDNGGTPQFREYWTTYSFGNLSEVAKTRKAVLEKVLPRLKISKVASIDGKFLKVKGTYKTYKIHIGSTNILMEPNDQYLCIVPSRGSASSADKLFLPFEGDRGFAILLSKAFLLAEDHKITDPTILSQLGK
ncbi:DUF4132 domain-containing protein [Tunicatimonas pelagia]|uniref:DUF4132 domain-containing protein n=1 Tax=Tunicatimonas pelagia TaxID=931531 RepID=UPI002666936D|nr:DUF4132 domain-containing protein [Tunicatimonas pelagia]WKN41155.1 DUF4132 domain-containing protein [Tunicatimonas pelagia]